MLSSSDMAIEDAISALATFGAEATYAVPTATTLEKFYFDATADMREYLRVNEIHNYATQLQSPAYRAVRPIWLIEPDHSLLSEIAFYRPATKTGDPRIRITGLRPPGKRKRSYAERGNLMAILADSSKNLFAVNLSNGLIFESIWIVDSPLNRLLSSFLESPTAAELRGKLEEISALGPIASLRGGATGIGFTLESMLGIEANSSRKPDYKGIELKSSRRTGITMPSNRSTLFAKTPDWALSALTKSEILHKYGYQNSQTARQELYCTVSNKPNPQALVFSVSENSPYLSCVATDSSGTVHDVAKWELAILEEALRDKHHETFWVGAETTVSGDGTEMFHFSTVTHTRAPLVANFRTLIALGKITMDLTMSEKTGGGVRDHGYLFKIHPRDLDVLFPRPRTFRL